MARHILCIEDNEDDQFLLKIAFSKIPGCTVHVSSSTKEAREYLEGKDRFSDRRKFPFPDLIITDGNLNGDSGIEFLRWLRSVPNLQEMPAVLLTGTAFPAQIKAAETLSDVIVFEKTGDMNKLTEIAEGLCRRARGE